jgi:hypothetical protein
MARVGEAACDEVGERCVNRPLRSQAACRANDRRGPWSRGVDGLRNASAAALDIRRISYLFAGLEGDLPSFPSGYPRQSRWHSRVAGYGRQPGGWGASSYPRKASKLLEPQPGFRKAWRPVTPMRFAQTPEYE